MLGHRRRPWGSCSRRAVPLVLACLAGAACLVMVVMRCRVRVDGPCHRASVQWASTPGDADGFDRRGNCYCGDDDDKFCLCTPSLAIDVVLEGSRGRGSVCLVRRRDNSLWSVLGGFVKVGESVRAAAAREVEEESGGGLRIPDPSKLVMLDVFDDPSRDVRRHTVSIAFFAPSNAIEGDREHVQGQDDAKAMACDFLLPRALLPGASRGGGRRVDLASLAFDHADILKAYAATIKHEA